jgi:dTDP-4-amino-4,6-dideoxygalactose transaminase
MSGSAAVTDDTSDRLVRLPLWLGIEDELDRVIAEVEGAVRSL